LFFALNTGKKRLALAWAGRGETAMADGPIWDTKTTPPDQLGWIKNNEAVNARHQKIATLRHGRIFSLAGEPLGYLRELSVVSDVGAEVPAFRRLCVPLPLDFLAT
jgi:hypothetical protein